MDTDGAINIINKKASEFVHSSSMLKEFYINAFLAETGYRPSECEVVTQHLPTGSRTFLRRREDLPWPSDEKIIADLKDLDKST